MVSEVVITSAPIVEVAVVVVTTEDAQITTVNISEVNADVVLVKGDEYSAVDQSLQLQINNLLANTNVSLSAESTARINGDDTLQENIDQEVLDRIAAIDDLKDGVSISGNTLKKLYNLILSSVHEDIVANIAARNAYNIPSIPFSLFVIDDGDGNWAKYQATSTGVGATFVKISDPDLLNSAMSASAIKASYESNPDTNAFTNALLSKLNGIASGATANDTDANLKNRANHTGTQTASTISDFATTVIATVLTGLNTALTGVPTSADTILQAIGRIAYFMNNIASTIRGTVLTGIDVASSYATIAATDTILTALGKLQYQITTSKKCRVVLSADVVNNNAVANTISDVTGLSFPVTSGKKYFFKFTIAYTAQANSTGSRWSINGPTNSRLIYTTEYPSDSTTQSTALGRTAYDSPATTTSASPTSAAGLAYIHGVIIPTADGNVIARFASEIANSAITALKDVSFVEWHEIVNNT